MNVRMGICVVYDSSDKLVSTGRTTGADGTFTLSGGQYATFADIKTNLNYTVYEYAKSGWWCVGGKSGSEKVTIASDGKLTVVSDGTTAASGDTSTITYAEKRSGVTASPTMEEFQNRCGSFVVKKYLSDGQTDNGQEFRFILRDGDGNAWANQSYYVYGTGGKLAKSAVQKTAADGSFTLLANQSAMFVGIEQGTKYTVEEPDSPLYECVTPKDGSYTETVGETVESLPFTNNLLESNGLYISKLAVNEPKTEESTDGTEDSSTSSDGDGANDAAENADASVDETQAALAEDGTEEAKTPTTLDELPKTDVNGNRLYTFRLVKVTVGSDGKETEEEVKDKTYNDTIQVAVNSSKTWINFYSVTYTDANGNIVTDANGDPVVIHVFQLASGDYAHFTKLTSGEYRVYEYGVDESVIATAKYTAADTKESEDSMSFAVDTDRDDSRDVKLAKTFTVDADTSQELAVTNDYTEEMFRISKTILDYKSAVLNSDGSGSSNSNSQIGKGGDTTQRFVYRIDKYESKSEWVEKKDPVSTTYTDFSCDKTGNGSVLVQGSGAGWYVITEMDSWSATDYDYGSCSYSGELKSEAVNADDSTTASTAADSTDGSTSAAVPPQYSKNNRYVAFELEDVYDAYNLPAAHFKNVESQYAYRSGQAYAENHMTLGY